MRISFTPPLSVRTPIVLARATCRVVFLAAAPTSLFHTFSPFLVLFLCCALHRVDFSKRINAKTLMLWPTQVTAPADVNRYFYCCGRRRSEFLLLWPAQARIFSEAGQCSGWHRQLFLFTQASIFTDTGLLWPTQACIFLDTC